MSSEKTWYAKPVKWISEAIADSIGISTFDELDSAHVKLMDSLDMLSGIEFDTVYINSQIRDHQMAIQLFQNETTNGKHEDIKAFAADLIPDLNNHLERAQSIADDLTTVE